MLPGPCWTPATITIRIISIMLLIIDWIRSSGVIVDLKFSLVLGVKLPLFSRTLLNLPIFGRAAKKEKKRKIRADWMDITPIYNLNFYCGKTTLSKYMLECSKYSPQAGDLYRHQRERQIVKISRDKGHSRLFFCVLSDPAIKIKTHSKKQMMRKRNWNKTKKLYRSVICLSGSGSERCGAAVSPVRPSWIEPKEEKQTKLPALNL